jgi:hypothetical protein
VQLEELLVVVEDREDGDRLTDPFGYNVRLFNDLTDGLSLAPHLRRAHLKSRINPTWQADAAEATLLNVLRRCRSTLTLLGLNAEVWRACPIPANM